MRIKFLFPLVLAFMTLTALSLAQTAKDSPQGIHSDGPPALERPGE